MLPNSYSLFIYIRSLYIWSWNIVMVPEVLTCIIFQVPWISTEYLYIMSPDATSAWSKLFSSTSSYYILYLQESVRSSAHGMTSPALESLVVTVESNQSTFSASPSPPRSFNTLPLQITGRSPTAGIDTLDSLRFYYKVEHSGIIFCFQGLFVDISAQWSRCVLRFTSFWFFSTWPGTSGSNGDSNVWQSPLLRPYVDGQCSPV